jgi:Rrf2 family protein
MKLSRTVSYAVQAALRLAEADSSRPIPCSKLAAEGQMPERFLLQILRHLVTHGILQSTRGVEGGYTLLRSPDKVSLLDILEAIEGPLDSSLPDGVTITVEQGTKLKEALGKVAQAAREQMAAIKLSDLATPARISTPSTN